MVLENIDLTELVNTIPGVSTLVKVTQVAVIIIIVYVLFLILRGILGFRKAANLGSIARNVEQINKKLEILISSIKKSEKNKK